MLEFWISDTERLVVPAAEAMPESSYSFAPTNGEFKGVRTFAEQVKHLAAANYQLGTALSAKIRPSVPRMSQRHHRFGLKQRSWNTSEGRSPAFIELLLRSTRKI